MSISKSRYKVLLLIVGLLLVTNLALLYFIFSNNESPKAQRPDRKAYIATFLKEEIGFDQQQLQRYDTMSDRHRERIGKIFEQGRSAKAESFRELTQRDFSDSAITMLADKAGTEQVKVEKMQLNHIRNIRSLCRADQLPAFDSLFSKVLVRGNRKRSK